VQLQRRGELMYLAFTLEEGPSCLTRAHASRQDVSGEHRQARARSAAAPNFGLAAALASRPCASAQRVGGLAAQQPGFTEQIGVSNRGTVEGLTQFPRTAVLVGAKPFKANEIEEGPGSRRRVR
jgi:hypothetical protein